MNDSQSINSEGGVVSADYRRWGLSEKLGNVITIWDRMVGMDNRIMGLAIDVSLLPGFGSQ
jgi:hypothetical protein